MPKTSYFTTHGTVWGETTNGVMTSYGHDALGSVTETYSGGALQNTYRYKPYGATLAKTGTAVDPSFLWNGGSGYRPTSRTFSEYYVRRRHVAVGTALWTTTDPLWPSELPFSYVRGRSTIQKDPSGLQGPLCCCQPVSISDPLDVSYYENQPLYAPAGTCSPYTLAMGNYFGALFTIKVVSDLNDAPNRIPNCPPPSWDEWWNTDTFGQPYTHITERPCFPIQWGYCTQQCPGSNSCNLYDTPGTWPKANILNNPMFIMGFTYVQNICIRLTMSGSCVGSPKILKYIYFSATCAPGKDGQPPIYNVSVSASNSSCNPAPMQQWVYK